MQSKKIHDLLVIGGGINGTGIARDAAGRGLSVVLCEKNDLASGTSSASTKLIHGGLRYLEHYHFKMVKQALNEREVLMSLAPNLITPLPFVIPYQPSGRPRWLIKLGLWLYDHLGKRSVIPASQSLELNQFPLIQEPLIPSVTQGFAYFDCWVDDARLVVANALSAHEKGAFIRTYCEVKSYQVENGLWKIQVDNLLKKTSETLWAHAIINATGPWVDGVRLVRGSHLVVPKQYEGNHAYLIQHPDQRVIFVIPYEQDFTLIGTTEVDTQASPDVCSISQEEIKYLIDLYNQHFQKKLSADDIVWHFSGVRPLMDAKQKNSSALSRDYAFQVNHEQGAPLLTVLGGKLTTYRTLSQAALDTLAPYLPIHSSHWTAKEPLPGGRFPEKSLPLFIASVSKQYPWVPTSLLERWARQYGSRIERVIGQAQSLDDLGQYFGADCYEQELRYLIQEEWARSAEDCLFRRTKLGLRLSAAEIEKIKDWLKEILAL